MRGFPENIQIAPLYVLGSPNYVDRRHPYHFQVMSKNSLEFCSSVYFINCICKEFGIILFAGGSSTYNILVILEPTRSLSEAPSNDVEPLEWVHENINHSDTLLRDPAVKGFIFQDERGQHEVWLYEKVRYKVITHQLY